MVQQVCAFFRNIFRKERLDRELDEEIRSYLDLVAFEKARGGTPHENALMDARRDVGGVEQIKESVRDIRIGVSMDTLLQDLRYAVRT